ncbi:exodeoxyribonuclease VII small subunit [Methanolobus chelungpuianus]|uniref:exodeoxyribonuclease VII small subunit n=1 Tax=Methanolobus chelungpuianus TaxID=502115 RepID=UPI00211590CC|nr:exodeoxyribonuclease VII small subunit [Methanolobus chelungpuianus]
MVKAKKLEKGAEDMATENAAGEGRGDIAESLEDDATFEESLEELEALVDRLERGQLLLDESLELFERGMKLARICNRKLSKAERKIEMLIEENGSLKTGPFMDE